MVLMFDAVYARESRSNCKFGTFYVQILPFISQNYDMDNTVFWLTSIKRIDHTSNLHNGMHAYFGHSVIHIMVIFEAYISFKT